MDMAPWVVVIGLRAEEALVPHDSASCASSKLLSRPPHFWGPSLRPQDPMKQQGQFPLVLMPGPLGRADSH